MLNTKIIKVSIAAVVAALLLAPPADWADTPKTADASMQNASSVAATSQTGQSMQTTGATLTVSYQYDSLGRLINESYPANTVAHSYDAAGNRTQSSTQ